MIFGQGRLKTLILVAIVAMVAEMPWHDGFTDASPGGERNEGNDGIERSERVQRHVLDNGLTVIMEENRFSPVVALMVWVKAGSAYEGKGEYGLAHVNEHMMFKGTGRRGVGQIAGEVEAAGGDINAYTSFDETVYYIVMPSRYKSLGLDILSDALFNSKFDANELVSELQVVLEEIKRGYDNPMTVLSQTLFETAYTIHPYGRPIIGYEDTVAKFTRQDVVNFYNKWYRPENMVLVAVGDFDGENMEAEIEKYFGVAATGPKRPPPFEGPRQLPREPAQNRPRIKIIRGDVSEVYLEMAFHIPDINGEDVPALDVMNYILGSGESSRLYRIVQADKGLVNGVNAYTFTPRDPGVAILGANLKPEKFRPAIEAMLKEVARFKSEPPGTEEISRAESNIESEAVYSRETVQGEARKLGFYEVIANDLDFEGKYLRAVEHVSGRDVVDVARKYYTPYNITITAYVPADAKIEGIDEESLERLAFATLEVPKTGDTGDKIVKKVLPNGLTVIVKEHRGVPIVSFRLAMLGGLRYDPKGKEGLANFIARTLTKGTAKRDAEEIAAEVENLAGSVSGFSGRDSIGLQGEFLSKYYSRGFDIFTDIVMNPMFISREVERQRREILSDIRRLKDRPQSLTFDLFRETLFGDHPYAARIYGDEKSVESIERRDMVSHYRNLLVPSNMVLAVVGDIGAEEIMPRVKETLGTIMARSPQIGPPEKAEPPKEPRGAKVERDKAQAQIVVGFMGPSLLSDDRYAMDVLANILGGQGGRLFVELRDRQHLAYAVGALNVPALDAGMFCVYMGTSPENRNEAVNGIFEELRRILNEPVGQEELSRAREYVAGSFEIGLQTVSSQAANFSLSEVYGLGYDESLKYPELIRRVTAEDVMRVARIYLDMNKYVIAELSPATSGDTTNAGK